MAFLALSDAGLGFEQFARKQNASVLVLPLVWCAFAGAWTHFGLGHLRLRTRIGFWALIWFFTLACGWFLNGIDPGHSAVFHLKGHLMNAGAGVFALVVGWPIARIFESLWQGFRRRRRRKKREQWRRWGVAW